MLLSLGQQQTTLYDQIEYAGAPESFAWVLPIKGIAEVGLSSDLLFNVLDEISAVTITSPTINCPPVQPCWSGNSTSSGFGTTSGSGGSGGGGGEPPPVVVVAQETVGPFETVQLSSTDPNALVDWLASHGYNIPSDILPLLSAYVSESFNFLAMKLIPGAGVQAMRPVRITTPGASPALPLRMVAAGTGVTTTVSLWVIGEGRYQPANFPWFTISASELVWNWDSQSSNFTKLRNERYEASNGLAWLVESAEGLSKTWVEGRILDAVMYQPETSGYDPNNAMQEAEEDLMTLFGTLSDTALWYTRLRAELSRAAFDNDLAIEAADSQAEVVSNLNVTNTIGTPPSCPPPPDCNGDGMPDAWEPNGGDDGYENATGCAARPASRTELGWGAPPLILLGLYLFAKRRRRRR
jgi:hypothetical protein